MKELTIKWAILRKLARPIYSGCQARPVMALAFLSWLGKPETWRIDDRPSKLLAQLRKAI